MSTEREILIFLLCLSLTLIGLGYLLKRLEKAVNNLWIDPPSSQEPIIHTQPDIPLTDETAQAKADLDRRTGHVWANTNAILLLQLEREHGIQFDKRVRELWSQFGIFGIVRLIKLRRHADVAMMPTRIED